MLKTIGYLVSTVSVLLLGAVAWHGASREAWTLAALIVGMSASILGMFFRWIAYVKEHRKKLRREGLKGPPFP